MYDIFLSYSRTDSDVVLQVAERLRLGNYRVFLDVWTRKRFFKRIWQHLEASLSKSQAVIFFFSKSALSSPWVKYEYFLTELRRIQHGSVCVFIHIYLDKCRIPSLSRTRAEYDLFRDNAEAINEVCDKIVHDLNTRHIVRSYDISGDLKAKIATQYHYKRKTIAQTILKDIILFVDNWGEQEHSSDWHGSSTQYRLYCLEWDSDNWKFEKRILASETSYAEYDHSTGVNTYYDRTIENLSFDGRILSWVLKEKKVVENEWISYYETEEEKATKEEYDTVAKKIARHE